MRSGSALGMGSPIYYRLRHMEPGEFYNINAKNITTRSANAIFYNYALEHSKLSNIHTFGDNLECFSPGRGGPFGGCFFNDVLIEHVFHGPAQKDMIGGRTFDPDGLHGTVFGFVKSTGEININDVHVDAVKCVFRVGGGVKINVSGYECRRANKEFEIEPDSTVIIDGERITNG